MMGNVWKYNQDLVKQLSEAKNFNDVTGIGLHETRRALEAARDNMAILQKSDVIAKTVDWLVSQFSCSDRPFRFRFRHRPKLGVSVKFRFRPKYGFWLAESKPKQIVTYFNGFWQN